MPKLILIRGYSGSGKSTLAKSIANKHKFALLGHDSFLFDYHPFKLSGKEYKLANQNLFSCFKNYINKSYSIILEGVFSSTDKRINDIDINKFVKLAKKNKYKIIKILLLVNKSESYKRTKKRGTPIAPSLFQKLKNSLDKTLYGDEFVIDTTKLNKKDILKLIEKEIF
jgi:predicted ABC-type ATPase